ncbi:NADPH oxidase regulator NoxR [Amylocystis lapponica]|nr:NADPH oxidase regulator NoxR [Amylocystis lapponica]
MSLKAELETWAAALKAYDEEDFEKSLQLFAQIADSSKILTNMGLIYATLGEHEAAVEQFTAAVQLDSFLAVAYFQCGVSNFLLQRYELAVRDFDDALAYLRGNQDIKYEQLGLKFQLWSAEVLFNKGLSLIYLGQEQQGLADMQEARKEKATAEHNVIDDAIADRGQGYTVFSIPVGVLYRPAENKLKNAKTKDYLGKARLVAAEDESEAYTEFTGVTRLKQGMNPSGSVLDGAATLSRSATVANPIPPPKSADLDKPVLQRAKTTINVSNPAPRANSGPASGIATSGLSRSMTNTARMSPPGGMGGPTRGLSIRKSGGPGPIPAAANSSQSPPYNAPAEERRPQQAGQRVTEFYDDYLDSYANEPVPPVPTPGPRRTPSTIARGQPLSQQRVRSVQQSNYNYSGGSMRRKPTRRGTSRASSSRAASAYEEDEEGYVSGDYDEPLSDVMRIRVKLHYKDDVRGMALTSDMQWEEFLERVTSKFGRPLDGLGMKFKDEDGSKVSLRDEMDYELAVETARESAKGKMEGRLEIWCTDE